MSHFFKNGQGNDGRRPDLLELGRRATGELPGQVPETYERALDDAKSKVAPFDFEILRARSHRLDEDVQSPAPVRRRSWLWTLAPALIAVLAAIVVITPRRPYVGTKGADGVRLDYFVLLDGQILPGEADQVLREGDRVQFTYMAAGLDTLVLLGIDGTGTLTVYWPEQGDEPQLVNSRGTQLLEGSVELDDAPGPEAFVGLFGFDDVDEARLVALDAWRRGGLGGLEDLADDSVDIDVIIIDKER